MAHVPRTPRKPRKRGTAIPMECSEIAEDLPDLPPSSFKSERVQVEVYDSGPTSMKTSSSAARRRQLELEAEAAKARLQIEAAEAQAAAAEAKAKAAQAQAEATAATAQAQAEAARVKANVTTELLEKQLAADVADLDSRKSHHSSISKLNNVTDWLNNTAEHASRHEHVRTDDQATNLNQLACALKEAIVDSSALQNKQLLTRLATSKDLPLYFGDPMEWLQFKEAYIESTRLCHYSDAENLWRLRKCLRGDAKEAVTALLIGGTSPQVILDTLELRFGMPENIITKIMLQLKRMHPLAPAYQQELIPFAIKVRNYVTATKALKQSDCLRSPELFAIVAAKLPSVLLSKWTDFYQINQGEIPRLELLSNFLYDEANKVAQSGVSHINTQNCKKTTVTDNREHKPIAHNVLVNTGESSQCNFCRKEVHRLPLCPRFKRAMRRDRWRYARTARLCYKCLAPLHKDSEVCPAKNCSIDGCNQPHHSLLHWVKSGEKCKDKSDDERADDQNTESVNHAVTSQRPKVLLKVVPLTVQGPAGALHAHALLDDGATVSLIAAGLADELGLTGQPDKIRMCSAWDNSEISCETQVLNIKVTNSESKVFSVRARKIKELNLPEQTMNINIDFSKYGLDIDSDIKNKFCNCNIKPTLLIGQDNHHLIAPIDCYRGEEREPYVTRTALGWCIHGSSVSDVTPDNSLLSRDYCIYDNNCCEPIVNVFHLCIIDDDDDVVETCYPSARSPDKINEPDVKQCSDSARHLDELHEEVRRSFLLDSIGIGTKSRRSPDDVRAVSILDETAELREGHWYVGLPWKSDQCMPNSYPNALRRLRLVQKKLLANCDYAIRYHERMHHLFTNNYARELVTIGNDSAVSNERVWYLPHFGVDNPNKRKLRLVFDAAAKTNNQTLNDFLLQGPDLLQSLLGIMFRFRENSIGIIGDIEDMFLRIKIRDCDTHALRFLWQDLLPSEGSPPGSNDAPVGAAPPGGDKMKECAMTSLIFGANCSPFIAQYINQVKNTEPFLNTMPDAVTAIRSNQYMDDYIDSVSDISTATQLIHDISFINQSGGFKMRNWLSNNSQVLDNTPSDVISDKAVRFNVEGRSERTLGLLWFPNNDTFGFDLSLKRIPKDILLYSKKPTKRELLSIIMSIFDLHGFLSPFTIKSKIIMQEVWKLGIKWDEQINDKLFITFRSWLEQLKSMSDIRIPRWYFNMNESQACATSASETTLQLHLFCDASPCAYAAVAYWRRIDNNGLINVSFIACKSRIAPLKCVTIPRLELQGALLASRLAETIKKEHRIKPVVTFYWTDSTVVLHWIRNENRNYKVFIANRLGEIDELSKINEWKYVPTDLNLADLATKTNDYDLRSDSSWFCGPSFLYRNPDQWPREPETMKNTINNDTLEVLTVFDTHNDTCDLPVPEPTRFSSWMRLLRCAATVLLFIAKLRRETTQRINAKLMKRAELLLLRHSQSQSFSREIDLLNKNDAIDRDSRLRSLTPYVDGDGLLRVGGRIGAATQVAEHVKSPIILDGKHHTARLIVKYMHERAAHGFNELVVNELRQTYWIVNLRPTVRRVASQCLICRIRKATPRPPRLGDLPIQRMTHHRRPFTMTGVDLFGPIEVTVGRGKQRPKRYGVLFTCLTVRAIHIEIVATLTADSLIMALRRMAARRGWPNTIISDNGTNLRGADVELRKSIKELNETRVETEALVHGVTWKFISPASPHMGGAWERLIRTVKTALKVVLKERAPREEVLTTLLAEVENIINSRPLTHVSVDPHSQEALTPNHFLIGSSSNVPNIGTFNDSELYNMKLHWRTAQRLTDMFWSRWVKEVLPVLIPRSKWTREGQQLRVGDLVIVVDPASPRNCWPKGIVERIYPGNDGRVRVVDVRTANGVTKRPSSKIALLELDTPK